MMQVSSPVVFNRPLAGSEPLFAGKKKEKKGYQNPTPDFTLMENAAPLVDNLLMGTPIPRSNMKTLLNRSSLLRKIPFLSFKKHLPKIAGRFKVQSFDFPQAEADKLKKIVRPDTAVFLAPNHPEYMTDWLLDKWISDRVAPKMASFAAAAIVQGPSGGFWLKNNLIANNGGKEAEAYAVDWALQGHGVLLHPEGTVHWNGNKIRHLVAGVTNMSIEAAKRSLDEGLDKPVYISAPVWKLAFVDDVSKGLHAEMTDLEKRLDLPSGKSEKSPAQRFYNLQQNLMDTRYAKLGLGEEAPELREAPFFERAEALLGLLEADLRSRYDIEDSGNLEQRLHRLGKAVAAKRSARIGELKAENVDKKAGRNDAVVRQVSADQKKVREMIRLRDFHADVYGVDKTLTQEEIAESLKALHRDTIKGTKSTLSKALPYSGPMLQGGLDMFAKEMPEPVGQRSAHIRATEPIDVTALLKQARKTGQSEADLSRQILEKLGNDMQETLDGINADIQPNVSRFAEPNPFHIATNAKV